MRAISDFALLTVSSERSENYGQVSNKSCIWGEAIITGRRLFWFDREIIQDLFDTWYL